MSSETQEVLDLLAQTDAVGETAAPEDDDEDTAGPDGEDEDVAGAELEAEEGDTGDIKALKARGKVKLSLNEVKALQARARKRGKAVGVKKAKAQVKRISLPTGGGPAIQLPPNMVPPNTGARILFDKWKKKSEPFVVRQEGHYYAVTEIRCPVEGTPERAWVRIPAGKYSFFELTVGDDMTYLGNPGKVTTNMTNFQRPSKNTYNEQDFLIRSITMQEAGLRVRYEGVDMMPNVGAAKNVLTGNAWLWDDAKVFLPAEIFHDFTGENLLYRALRRSGVLFFNWDKRRVGGNGTMRQVLIDHLRNVPDTKVKSLSRTSGGAAVLPVPDGYIFTDNPERSDEGAFSAIIQTHEDIVFPVKPIDIAGDGKPVKPLEIGLYLQLSLNGMSFEHAKRSQPTAA